jgi:hypothetical protein
LNALFVRQHRRQQRRRRLGAEFGFSSLADNTAGVAGAAWPAAWLLTALIFGNQAAASNQNWLTPPWPGPARPPSPRARDIAADPLFINATGQDYRPDAALAVR